MQPSRADFRSDGGVVLGHCAACLWWIGDALNYGEKKWGEMYAQALDKSDYEYQTLRDAKWVCSEAIIAKSLFWMRK